MLRVLTICAALSLSVERVVTEVEEEASVIVHRQVPKMTHATPRLFGVDRDRFAQLTGRLGAAMGIALSLSAWPVAVQIYRERKAGEFSCMPYIFQAGNCALWLVYIYADPTPAQRAQLLPALLANAVGVSIGGSMCLFFASFATAAQRRTVASTVFPLVVCTVMLYFHVKAAAWSVDHDGQMTGPRKRALQLTGLFCLLANIACYMGPLAGVRHALETKSTQYLPVSLGIATIACSLPWLAFGLTTSQPAIWLANACGLVCGTAQVSVYFTIRAQEPEREGLVGKEPKWARVAG